MYATVSVLTTSDCVAECLAQIGVQQPVFEQIQESPVRKTLRRIGDTQQNFILHKAPPDTDLETNRTLKPDGDSKEDGSIWARTSITVFSA